MDSLVNHIFSLLARTVFAATWSMVNGRLTLFLVPFLPSQITFTNLVKVTVAGGLAEGLAMILLALGHPLVSVWIEIVHGGAAEQKFQNRSTWLFEWVQGLGDSYVCAFRDMWAGPIGLAIMRRVGVTDPKGPTMLYLALMGLVGTVMTRSVLLPFIQGLAIPPRSSRRATINPSRRRRRDIRPRAIVQGDN